jgi:hypothetical protein
MTVLEWKAAAAKLEVHSSHVIFYGCIGAFDGWVCWLHVPSSSEAKSVTDYFSGQYQCHVLNVQATTCNASRATVPKSMHLRQALLSRIKSNGCR